MAKKVYELRPSLRSGQDPFTILSLINRREFNEEKTKKWSRSVMTDVTGRLVSCLVNRAAVSRSGCGKVGGGVGIPSGQPAKNHSFLNVGEKDSAEGRPAYSVATHGVRLSLWSASSFKSRCPFGRERELRLLPVQWLEIGSSEDQTG
ncbi:uncharacterized protein LOC143260596 [Megalopta genalis]|uniref:uncharacterized protein LOC143260596 n=1 Tax=Megalopta genalis TaxID=115081 RepID=UPI003FD4A613